MDELNKLFGAWLSEGYNNRPHSALGDKTPSEVFASDNTPLRFHTSEVLKEAFFHETDRTVDKTGCFHLDGKLYDAGAEWRRKKITVRFDPFNLGEVQLWHEGKQKKIVTAAVIGEFNATQKVAHEKVEQSAESRVLKVFMEEQQKRFKKKTGAFSLSQEEE